MKKAYQPAAADTHIKHSWWQERRIPSALTVMTLTNRQPKTAREVEESRIWFRSQKRAAIALTLAWRFVTDAPRQKLRSLDEDESQLTRIATVSKMTALKEAINPVDACWTTDTLAR